MHSRSLQAKISLSYICIIVAILALMNSYPILASEDLVFRSKKNTLQNSVSVMVAALAELRTLTMENVSDTMTLLDQTDYSRVLVSDRSGAILYDTQHEAMLEPGQICDVQMLQALDGYDLFYASYVDGAFQSRAASPIIYHNQTIGAVYAYERDLEQAALIETLQETLLTISAAVALCVLLLSILVSQALTRRFAILAEAIEQIREGSYGFRAEIGGEDEIARIATEFNRLADRLQTTEDARRRFVADASHELKTPLAGIRLFSDSILQNENMDAETLREFVGDIGQEAERLTRITEHLLRLTKLDSGVVESAHPVPLGDIIQRALRLLRPVADERGVTIDAALPQDCEVLASEDDLHQILYNLMENAVKYNRAGGFVRVLVSTTAQDCVITVEDNGVGIPDEDMPRIFDRFYRVDKMRSRAAGGTGLGLSIVSDTVKRRGGRIEVAAREGGGVRFTVYLARGGQEG